MSAPLLSDNLQVKSLFPTPLVIAELKDCADFNQRLKETILQRMETTPSVSKTNRGGWQSDTDFVNWSGAEGKHLLDMARELGTRLTIQQQGDKLGNCTIDWAMNAWANVNGASNSNDAHTHAGAYWSGCYYVDTGSIEGTNTLGGALELMDPRGVAPMLYAPNLRLGVKGCLTAGMSEYHQPCAGQMVMFPSWLFHAVQAYTGNALRISIAFNLSLPNR